jgi:O-acetylserine/cysteine efflux transporter
MQIGATGHGIAWALVAAVLETGFVLPWKVAAQSGPVSTAVLVMLASAALFSSAALPWARRLPGYRAQRRSGRREWVLAAELALLTLLGNWASAHAVARLSPSLLTVLMRSEVLLVALLALFLLGERVERRFWLGAALAGLGLCLIQGVGEQRAESLWGLLAALTAAASFGTMTVITRRVIREIDPVRVNMLRLWLSVALWFAVNGAPPPAAELTPQLVGFAALAALCGPFGSRLCLMFSGRYVDARVTAMIGLSAPVLTLFAAGLVLGDWPAPRELFGGAVMLLGIAVPISGWMRRSAPLAPPAQPQASQAQSAR